MIIYKTKCGYFYKKYKNGKKIRISKKDYLKYSKKKKLMSAGNGNNGITHVMNNAGQQHNLPEPQLEPEPQLNTSTNIEKWEEDAHLVTIFSGVKHMKRNGMPGALDDEFQQLANSIVNKGYGISYGCSVGSQTLFLEKAIEQHRRSRIETSLKVKCVGFSRGNVTYSIYDKFNTNQNNLESIQALRDYPNSETLTIYHDNHHKRTVELMKNARLIVVMPGGPCTMLELWLSAYLNFLRPPEERVQILVVNCVIQFTPKKFFDGVKTMLEKFRTFEDKNGHNPFESFVNNCGLEVLDIGEVIDRIDRIDRIESRNIHYKKSGNVPEIRSTNISVEKATNLNVDDFSTNENTCSVFMGMLSKHLSGDHYRSLTSLITKNINTTCFKMGSYLNLTQIIVPSIQDTQKLFYVDSGEENEFYDNLDNILKDTKKSLFLPFGGPIGMIELWFVLYKMNEGGRKNHKVYIYNPESGNNYFEGLLQQLNAHIEAQYTGFFGKIQRRTLLNVITNEKSNLELSIVLRLGSVFDGEIDFNDTVLVDAAGPYLKDKKPENAGSSSGHLYRFLGIEQLQEKATSNMFETLTPGNVVHTTYNKNSVSIDVIHAYSYNFKDPSFNKMREDDCINAMTSLYIKVFETFINTNKPVLHLLPLSSGIFGGKIRYKMKYITFNAIKKAYQQLLPMKPSLCEKTIILCLYHPSEFGRFFSTGLYTLVNNFSLCKYMIPSLNLNCLFIEDSTNTTNTTNTTTTKYSNKNLRQLSDQSLKFYEKFNVFKQNDPFFNLNISGHKEQGLMVNRGVHRNISGHKEQGLMVNRGVRHKANANANANANAKNIVETIKKYIEFSLTQLFKSPNDLTAIGQFLIQEFKRLCDNREVILRTVKKRVRNDKWNWTEDQKLQRLLINILNIAVSRVPSNLSSKREIVQEMINNLTILTSDKLIYLNFKDCNTQTDFAIEYAAIMNALNIFKRTYSEDKLNLIMSRLRFKMNLTKLKISKEIFFKHFYVALPFHLRFNKYLKIEDPNVNTILRNVPTLNKSILFRQLNIELIRHKEGSVGVAKLLDRFTTGEYKIGVFIAGNSGCPGGLFSRQLGSNFINNQGEIKRARHRLQEESVIQEWLFNEQTLDFLGGDILNHTIRGQWGLYDLDLDASPTDYETIQGINYTEAEPIHYRTSWVCEDCCLDSSTNLRCHLVFVAGPNISGIREPNGSMTRTFNKEMKCKVIIKEIQNYIIKEIQKFTRNNFDPNTLNEIIEGNITSLEELVKKRMMTKDYIIIKDWGWETDKDVTSEIKKILGGSSIVLNSKNTTRKNFNLRTAVGNFKTVQNTTKSKNLNLENTLLQNQDSFITGIKEAIYAGLYAAYKSGCSIVLVPYISGGIYYSNNRTKQDRLKMIYPIILNDVINLNIPDQSIRKTFKQHFDHIILCDIINNNENKTVDLTFADNIKQEVEKQTQAIYKNIQNTIIKNLGLEGDIVEEVRQMIIEFSKKINLPNEVQSFMFNNRGNNKLTSKIRTIKRGVKGKLIKKTVEDIQSYLIETLKSYLIETLKSYNTGTLKTEIEKLFAILEQLVREFMFTKDGTIVRDFNWRNNADFMKKLKDIIVKRFGIDLMDPKVIVKQMQNKMINDLTLIIPDLQGNKLNRLRKEIISLSNELPKIVEKLKSNTQNDFNWSKTERLINKMENIKKKVLNKHNITQL